MKTWLDGVWLSTKTNFWFIPAVMSAMAIVSGIIIVNADLAMSQRGIFGSPPLIVMSLESGRLVLSTIAGSMVTVASLVFSMTLVALTTVSQQLGPRILMRFMDDRPTQITLGAFIATFLFSLILLIRLGDAQGTGVISGLGVTAAAALAVGALGVMIHFFDHVSKRIQADALIAELGHELNNAVTNHLRISKQESAFPTQAEQRDLRRRLDAGPGRSISPTSSGYLRRIDAPTVCQIACQNDLLVRLNVHPGEYILEGMTAIEIWPLGGDNAITEKCVYKKMAELLVVGPKRTPEAAIEFEFSALVEVALRALSPGINDPFTAIACINRIADALRQLASRPGEQLVRRDDADVIRLVYAPEPLAGYLRRSIAPINDAAQSNQLVLDRLGAVLDHLISTTDDDMARREFDNARRWVANSAGRD